MLIVMWRNWLPSVTVTGSCPRYAAWILMFTLLITTLTMDICPTCTRHVLLHAKQIRCCVCQENYHIKCLSLRAVDPAHIYSNADTWYCPKCLSEIFPFNQIDDDDMFVMEVNQLDVCTRTIESLTKILFNSFELNDDHHCPLNDVDPDQHFFSMNLYILLMEVAIITLNSPFVRYWISISEIFLTMVHSLWFIWISEA